MRVLRLCATVPGAAVPSRGAASAAVALDLKGEVYALSALPLAGTAMVVQMHGKGAAGTNMSSHTTCHNATPTPVTPVTRGANISHYTP